MKNYCKNCGGKVIKKEILKGSCSKQPEYFDEETGKEIWHERWQCENVGYWNVSHTEYYVEIFS
ncbi:hypothetical protein M0R04_13755 [Candidatus Dojkabacteria bacterium]|jgi:hypothetical protein|nr:hypothetical protein [Candidatus Dojkabacteria bacterium]